MNQLWFETIQSPVHGCKFLQSVTGKREEIVRFVCTRRCRPEDELDPECPHQGDNPPCSFYETWDGKYAVPGCEDVAALVAGAVVRTFPAHIAVEHWAVRYFGWDVEMIGSVRRRLTDDSRR